MLTEDLKAVDAAFVGGPSNQTVSFLLNYSKAVNIKQVAGRDITLILN